MRLPALSSGVGHTLSLHTLLSHRSLNYEIQDVEMGKVYRWCPERAVLECTCGEQVTLSAFRSTCPECGADHAPNVEEVLDARPEDKGDHPWRCLQPHTPMRGA